MSKAASTGGKQPAPSAGAGAGAGAGGGSSKSGGKREESAKSVLPPDPLEDRTCDCTLRRVLVPPAADASTRRTLPWGVMPWVFGCVYRCHHRHQNHSRLPRRVPAASRDHLQACVQRLRTGRCPCGCVACGAQHSTACSTRAVEHCCLSPQDKGQRALQTSGMTTTTTSTTVMWVLAPHGATVGGLPRTVCRTGEAHVATVVRIDWCHRTPQFNRRMDTWMTPDKIELDWDAIDGARWSTCSALAPAVPVVHLARVLPWHNQRQPRPHSSLSSVRPT